MDLQYLGVRVFSTNDAKGRLTSYEGNGHEVRCVTKTRCRCAEMQQGTGILLLAIEGRVEEQRRNHANTTASIQTQVRLTPGKTLVPSGPALPEQILKI
jgi:hypothetical protein